MSHLMNEKCSIKSLMYRQEGNLRFQSRIFGNAARFYNHSLCYAEGDTLSLAYANRSAVSIECNEYDACLRNIQLAMDHNYPNNKMAVLNERKSRCLKLMESDWDSENHWELLKLSYPANVKVPFIVDCLELNTNEKYGRHIITNKDLKVGDIVAIEKLYIAHLDKDYVGCCATCCATKPLDLMPCSSNVNDMFCSKTCNELAMKTFLRSKSEEVTELFGKMPMRMYMNALNLFNGSTKTLRDFLCANHSTSKTIFDYDFSNADEIENDKNRLLAAFSLIDDIDFTDKDINEFASYFLECALKISTKYTTLSLDESFYGIYLFNSLVNQSFTPNFVALQFGTKKLHLVIRPILKGEQLLTCYSACISTSRNGDIQARRYTRFDFSNPCGACPLKDELRIAGGDLNRIELPSWPKLDRSSTVNLAIERFKLYCAMLQSTPELLSKNYNGILITEYIVDCVEKIITNKPQI